MSVLPDTWIRYPKAEKILSDIQKVIDNPRKDRPVNFLITGPTNNGKSRMLNEIQQRNPNIDIPERHDLIIPVVRIYAPPMPGSNRLFNSILDSLNCPYRINGSSSYKENKVYSLFEKLEVRILLIDEFQHINMGSSKQQGIFLNTLKNFTNKCKISIVAAGVEEAIYTIQSDSQIRNRFITHYLDKWSHGEDYIRLLMTLETVSERLKKSKISRPPLSRSILGLSEGIFGHIREIVEKLDEYCEDKGIEIIEKKHISEIDFTPPSLKNY